MNGGQYVPHLGVTDGLVQDGSLVVVNLEGNADGGQRGEDVAEEDDAVGLERSPRLKRDLRDEIRRLRNSVPVKVLTLIFHRFIHSGFPLHFLESTRRDVTIKRAGGRNPRHTSHAVEHGGENTAVQRTRRGVKEKE